MSSPRLKIVLPKGSLQEATYRLFERAGWRISDSSRSYFPRIDDPELEAVLIRAQEIARYVQDGVMDCGLTGRDWVVENDADVVEVAALVFAKQTSRPVRWVVAVPNRFRDSLRAGPAGETHRHRIGEYHAENFWPSRA